MAARFSSFTAELDQESLTQATDLPPIWPSLALSSPSWRWSSVIRPPIVAARWNGFEIDRLQVLSEASGADDEDRLAGGPAGRHRRRCRLARPGPEGCARARGSGEVLQQLPQLDEAQAGRRRTVEQHDQVAAQGHGERGPFVPLKRKLASRSRAIAASRPVAGSSPTRQVRRRAEPSVKRSTSTGRSSIGRRQRPGIVEGEAGQADIGTRARPEAGPCCSPPRSPLQPSVSRQGALAPGSWSTGTCCTLLPPRSSPSPSLPPPLPPPPPLLLSPPSPLLPPPPSPLA